MNSKKNKRNARVKIWAWNITYKDVRNMEKIIKKHLKPMDQYVVIGRDPRPYSYISHSKNKKKYYRKLHIRTKVPNLDIYVNPFRVIIFGQRTINKNEKLRQVDKTVSELQRYIKQR